MYIIQLYLNRHITTEVHVFSFESEKSHIMKPFKNLKSPHIIYRTVPKLTHMFYSGECFVQ